MREGKLRAFPDPLGEGMQLRDWFAGQALAGYLANPNITEFIPEMSAKNIYQIADAMLWAREK